MQIIGARIYEEMGGSYGYTVEFVGDSDEVVSVQLRQSVDDVINKANAVEKAKLLLRQAVAFDPATQPETPEQHYRDAWRSAHDADEKAELEKQLEEGVEDSFRASDPVSVTQPVTASLGDRDRKD